MTVPNQVPESAMEEIVESLRKIISEDRSKLATAMADPSSNSASDTFESNISRLFDQNGAGSEAVPDVASSDDQMGPTLPADRGGDHGIASEAPRPAEIQSLDSLLAPETGAAVAAAFDRLGETIAASNARSTDQLTEALVRPMLREWLDRHLPVMVEKIVREEIERVVRRR